MVGRKTQILKKQMDGQMDRKNRWMVGWIENNKWIQKWNNGWIEKMDGWMDKKYIKKQMDG